MSLSNSERKKAISGVVNKLRKKYRTRVYC